MAGVQRTGRDGNPVVLCVAGHASRPTPAVLHRWRDLGARGTRVDSKTKRCSGRRRLSLKSPAPGGVGRLAATSLRLTRGATKASTGSFWSGSKGVLQIATE